MDANISGFTAFTLEEDFDELDDLHEAEPDDCGLRVVTVLQSINEPRTDSHHVL